MCRGKIYNSRNLNGALNTPGETKTPHIYNSRNLNGALNVGAVVYHDYLQ